MNQTQEHLEALQDIRSMMKKSTRFLSLSGLSGVFAGIYAIAGAIVANYIAHSFSDDLNYYDGTLVFEKYMDSIHKIYTYMFIDALLVLFLSIGTGFIFSYRKAKKTGQKLFDHTALRLFINLIIPIGAGGVLCLILLNHGYIGLIAPVMLLFYGMALLNASKYTLDDIRYLGICEIVLGLLNAWLMGYGLWFWVIGFGVLHIVYGLVMWIKYEKGK